MISREDRLKSRIAKWLQREGDCLVWTGCRLWSGHGQIRVAGKTELVHRIVWALQNGPIPDGMEVCHECDNPPCCDESHLFLGTHEKNLSDMAQKERSGTAKLTTRKAEEIRHLYAGGDWSLDRIAKEYDVSKRTVLNTIKGKVWQHAGGPISGPKVKSSSCPQGHAYTEGNTLWHRGGRRCRECHRLRENRRHYKKKRQK